jgi:hypothetical protein
MATRVPHKSKSGTCHPPWSKKKLFRIRKRSEKWHDQVTLTAGPYGPLDLSFPWSALRRHTDHYIKSKKNITKGELNVKLASLIKTHEEKVVAIAACAHAMSTTAVKAILASELDIVLASLEGLNTYLLSLFAANFSCPSAVSDFEAKWAKDLLPYVEHGSRAAGRFLEGICMLLQTSNILDFSSLDFSSLDFSSLDFSSLDFSSLPFISWLARRSCKVFTLQLETMKSSCD